MGVRTTNATDVESVAKIHKARFGTHFLGQFSTCLIRKFYTVFLDCSVFLVYEGQDGVEGFVLGGESGSLASCRKQFVKKHLVRCGLEMLCQPRLYAAGFRRMWQMFLPRKPAKTCSEGIRLLSIAVTEGASGRGISVQLVRAFEDAIRDRASSYGLSVRTENFRAIGFYRKMGFTVVQEGDDGLCLSKSVDPSMPVGPAKIGGVCPKPQRRAG